MASFVRSHQTGHRDIYQPITISRRVPLHIRHIGGNQQDLHEKLENVIAGIIEGKCVVQGFVQPNSVKLVEFSAGVIQASRVVFEATFRCHVCKPEISDVLTCITKNVTKAGIRAEVRDCSGRYVVTPVVIFVARDHFGNNDDYFDRLQEGEIIQVEVVGQRFELYDKYISVIGKLVSADADADANADVHDHMDL